EAGDVIETEAPVDAIVISESGKMVEVKATLRKRGNIGKKEHEEKRGVEQGGGGEDDKSVAEVVSRFLYRGEFKDYTSTFRRSAEKPMKVVLATKKDVAVLLSKPW